MGWCRQVPYLVQLIFFAGQLHYIILLTPRRRFGKGIWIHIVAKIAMGPVTRQVALIVVVLTSTPMMLPVGQLTGPIMVPCCTRCYRFRIL